MFTWQGAVVAAAVVCMPLVYKTARAAFESVDKNLEHAARTLGATEWTLFWRIFFPLAWRGILAGTMLAFARSMGEFGATLMVAGNLPGRTQTLSTAIYSALQAGQDRYANMLVIIASVLGLLILYMILACLHFHITAKLPLRCYCCPLPHGCCQKLLIYKYNRSWFTWICPPSNSAVLPLFF